MKENKNTLKETLELSAKAQSYLKKIAVYANIFVYIGFTLSFVMLYSCISTRIEGRILFMKGIDAILQTIALCCLAIPTYFLLLFCLRVNGTIKTQNSIKLKESLFCLSTVFKIFSILFFVLVLMVLVLGIIDLI